MAWTSRARIIAVAAVLGVVAGAAALRYRGGGETGGTGWLAGRGRPVRLELTFAPERGRAREIGPEGGAISATTSDGALVELRIPEGALAYRERISIIPITSVRGLPLAGGSIAAVHLKPDGLRLLKPATLSIRPRIAVPVAEQVAFAYTGNGRDAFLYPMMPDPRRIELPILHFSGYGFGQAPPNDPGRKALQSATDKEARLQSQVAAIIAEERGRIPAGGDETSRIAKRIEPLMIQYYDEVLRPLMSTAEHDERMAECALQRFLSWERQLTLAGLVDPDAAQKTDPELGRRVTQGWASLRAIRENAYEKRMAAAVRRCREEHDFAAVNDMLGLEKEYLLLGGGRSSSALAEAWKCLSFEVEFRSVIDQKRPTGGMYYHVLAKVPVSLALGSARENTDSGPLEYVAFRASGNPIRDLRGGTVPAQGDMLGMLHDADGTISSAGTRPGVFRVLGLNMSSSKKPFRQTTCKGEDEEQQRETTDSVSVMFYVEPPVEKVRFTPSHAGETGGLARAVAAQAEAMGLGTEANDLRSKARIDGATVEEETGWAESFERFHGDDAVKWPGAPPAAGANGGGIFALNLRPVTPGVWRVDFKSDEPPVPELPGFSKSESGYMIVRHTPK